MYRAEKHRVAMVSLRETAMFHGAFPPGTFVVPLWDRADFMLTQHADSDDDVAFKPVQVPFKYLLIIHLRKKSAAWRKVSRG